MFDDYKGDDPVAFVISRNLHRRHLSTSQRAMVAGKIANLTLGSNQHKEGAEFSAPSQDQAAEAFKVDRRTVQHARKVIDKGTEELVRRQKHEIISAPEDVTTINHHRPYHINMR